MKASKLLLMMTLVAVSATAQVYKWKDAQGRIHYSDVPPSASQANSEVVNTRNTPVSSVETPKAPPIAATKPPPAAQASEVTQIQKDPTICLQARARKSFLQSGQLTRSVNEKGEVEFLSEEKRQADIAEADKAIAANCP